MKSIRKYILETKIKLKYDRTYKTTYRVRFNQNKLKTLNKKRRIK